MSIDDPRATQGGALKGCPICGGGWIRKISKTKLNVLGLGHGLSDCPKLEESQRRVQAAQSRYSGGGY